MVHGIGQRLEKSNLVDDVGEFHHITASLAETHLTSRQRDTQRVLFIPCQVSNLFSMISSLFSIYLICFSFSFLFPFCAFCMQFMLILFSCFFVQLLLLYSNLLIFAFQWRKGLKLSGETAVEKCTLDGVKGLRVMLSATVHDVLYYMSPIYCQDIINAVVHWCLNFQCLFL